MKKEWKVRSVILLTQFLIGVGWICVGVCNLFPERLIADVISLIVLAAVALCSILAIRVRKEAPDEMARRHLEKAQATGYMVLGVCLMAVYLFGEFGQFWEGASVPFQASAPIFFGIGSAAVGLYFYRLETRGEPWQDW